EVMDRALSKSVTGRIERAHLSIEVMGDATFRESEPETVRGIRRQSQSKVPAPYARPRDLLDRTVPEQLKKAEIPVGNPQLSPSICDHGICLFSVRKTVHWDKAVVFQVPGSVLSRDPDSPTPVLKQRRHQPVVRHYPTGNLAYAGSYMDAALAIQRNLS